MASTLAEKLIASAADRAAVTAGEIVTCKVDLAMFHDSSGPRRLQPMLAELGANVWDSDKIVVVTDHYVPATDANSRQIVQLTRDWVRDNHIRHFYDQQGICHVVLPQHGHLRPGMFCVGGDSHSPTGGAFGAYMFGIGSTEMLGVVVTGEIWIRVPRTIRIELNGVLHPRTTAKDIMLMLIGSLGMDGGDYQAVEFSGTAVEALSMQERMTLTNMTAELGAQTGLIAPDATTLTYLHGVGVDTSAIDVNRWRTDDDAPSLRTLSYDASELPPMVAAPHSPANSQPVDAFVGQPVDIAYIGACTGAKFADIAMAASLLRGKRIAPGTQLWLAPASEADQAQAEREGMLQILLDAGAQLLPTACGACAGYGDYRFAAGARVISTTARNFKGRMGDATSQVYLASPFTVAASAVSGVITDPRTVS